MRAIVFMLAFGFSIFLCGKTSAVTVRIEGGTGATIPEFVQLNGDPLPLTIDAQIFNESTSDPVTLAFWQLQLKVISDSSATGVVELSQILAPDTLFFDFSNPQPDLPNSLPSAEVLVQDTDFPIPPDLPGKSLSPEESRDIAKLLFSSPDNATGTFYLVLGAFLDPPSELNGSVWLPDGLPNPTPFANTPGPDLPGEITLAKLLFGIQAADFNEEGNVDAIDLALWQSGFGTSSGASHGQGDSDRDGDVDGADFLTWQRQFEGSPPVVTSMATQIPEPTAFLLVIVFLAGQGFFRDLRGTHFVLKADFL